jgi:DNA-binding XRE family transcriptional regulator
MREQERKTCDGIKILHKRFYVGRPARLAALEEARCADQVARDIQVLRQKAGITQRQLARLVGTTPSVISRLENAEYQGHSMAMLRRVAAAFDRRVELRFVPLGKKLKAA